jgi:hypothetical protein
VTSTDTIKTIKWISYYNIYVNDVVGKYNFLPDYNARYTVLAWDSYIREWSQILYDTTPWASQSLAVSTLLSTPYSEDILFSLFPGGWWTLWEPSDMSIETTISARWAFLTLDVSDTASQSAIARVAYPLLSFSFAPCTESWSESDICDLPGKDSGIVFALFPESEYRIESGGSSMSIIENTEALITYANDRWLSLAPGVSLVPRSEYSQWRLVADIEYAWEVIGRVILGLRESDGVDIGMTTDPVNKLTLDAWHAYSRQDVYSSVFSPGNRGYSIYRESSEITLDERIIWPGHIGSFGSLRESPWVW